MSLNQIYGVTTSNRKYTFPAGFKDINVNSFLSPREFGVNKNGFVLQSYDDNKATFLPPPRINELDSCRIFIDPDPAFKFTGENPPNSVETYTIKRKDPAGIENTGTEIIEGVEDDTGAFIVKFAGLYLVTYKISINKGIGYFQATLNRLPGGDPDNAVPIPVSISTLPNINYNPSSAYYGSLSASFALLVQNDDTIYNLTLDYITSATEDNNLTLSPNVAEDNTVSVITFCKLTA